MPPVPMCSLGQIHEVEKDAHLSLGDSLLSVTLLVDLQPPLERLVYGRSKPRARSLRVLCFSQVPVPGAHHHAARAGVCTAADVLLPRPGSTRSQFFPARVTPAFGVWMFCPRKLTLGVFLFAKAGGFLCAPHHVLDSGLASCREA